MHIILMLFLVLAGYAVGQNATYLLGLPIMAVGLYIGFGDWGGKKGARRREEAEGMFFLLGLMSMVLLFIFG